MHSRGNTHWMAPCRNYVTIVLYESERVCTREKESKSERDCVRVRERKEESKRKRESRDIKEEIERQAVRHIAIDGVKGERECKRARGNKGIGDIRRDR